MEIKKEHQGLSVKQLEAYKEYSVLVFSLTKYQAKHQNYNNKANTAKP